MLGGHPAAEFTAPTAFHLGGLNTGPGFCYLAGHHRFYTAAELKARYGVQGPLPAAHRGLGGRRHRPRLHLPHDALAILAAAARTKVS